MFTFKLQIMQGFLGTLELLKPYEELLVSTTAPAKEIRDQWMGRNYMALYNKASSEAKLLQDELENQFNRFVAAGATGEEQETLIEEAKNLYIRVEQRKKLLILRGDELFSLLKIRFEKLEILEGKGYNPWNWKRAQGPKASSGSRSSYSGGSSSSSGGYTPPRSSYKTEKEKSLEVLNQYLSKFGSGVLSATASTTEVRQAQMSLVKKLHPDVGGKVEDMQAVNAACDVLRK